ncbi:hypothetical protein [Herbaspirillum frisingense]|uniref:hypothetical protein n=1 Tax=Herbaspirillum frisingense TaxID=92645 RepID=UPI001F250F05|nr:hypothetical protein [Herbaspirillum frisingense]UIN23343.1 hypothetical protein LAZ82_09695 [Herbaspirillum frisingense]
MKKSIPLMAGLAVFAAVAGLSAAPAMAGHVSIGVNIGVPGAYVAPQPVYVQPAPVYAPPPVYVRPAPVYYGPPPVYVAPGYYRGHHHRHWHRPPPPPGYWHR